MRLLTFLLALLAIPASAVPMSSVESLLPPGSQLSLVVDDLGTSKATVRKNADRLVPPASTLKLATALAATLALPEEFRFNTTLELSGNNVIFRFSGDPTLTRTNLETLVSNLKKRGIKQITGDIILDTSIFSGYERAPGWPWDILGVCYSAPSSAITVDHNCVQGAIYSEEGKQLTRVHVPSFQNITVSTDAAAVTKEQQKSSHCDLELYYDNQNTYRLSGCLTNRKKPLPLKFAVINPDKFASGIIHSALEKNGIQLAGAIKTGKAPSGRILATHQSNPLPALIREMVKDSDNLIADNLLKTLGSQIFHQPGSFANGSEAVKKVLEEKAGILLKNAVIVDGSGLSRNNRVSAHQLSQIVSYIYHHPKLGLMGTLPVSGVDGTLKYRQSLRQEPVKGRVQAKSGSLYGTYNLAGIVKTEAGKDVLVIQMVSDYFPERREDDSLKNVPSPIEQFERELYRAVINSTLTLH
ncbi:serine-type D-Ala-D-Ala carboxypeptidase [Parasalinivibrio latis]|uniref:serine-type D-Ala-D-Ala carboxypeptidase n=1 Tax=Parasalinivibrio latis TaxID=2952610 RepID=UPI0030E09A0E